MEPSSNVAYLSWMQEHLAEFTAALDELYALHVENIGINSIAPGIAPALIPREGADEQRVTELTNHLDELAGELMDLSSLTSVQIGMAGQRVDPFVNWAAPLRPKPLLEASDVRRCVRQAAGRLRSLRARADALDAPDLDPTRFHRLVWAAADRLWRDGHLRQAVEAAAQAVTEEMKQLTGRSDAEDTPLWQEAFSEKDPAPGAPRLRWPGDRSDKTVRNMLAGLRQFAPGTNMVIRNSAAHGNEVMSGQEGLERLATLSLLARLLDVCEVDTPPEAVS